jgi:hypothetical protein
MSTPCILSVLHTIGYNVIIFLLFGQLVTVTTNEADIPKHCSGSHSMIDGHSCEVSDEEAVILWSYVQLLAPRTGSFSLTTEQAIASNTLAHRTFNPN